jgi:hypothetical protein
VRPFERGAAGAGWLLAGLIAGSLVTAGLVLGGVRFVRQGIPTEAAEPPRFVEQTATTGVEHVYDGEFNFFVGGGVAVFDCNDDGRPDLYFAGGASSAALFGNESPIGGELRFGRIESTTTDLDQVTGAYPIDVDGDGLMDLVILRVGENVMLRGMGGCRFERANEAWGIDGGDGWTTAFSAKWEGPAALPTLAFGNYLSLNDSQRTECSDNVLFRPAGEAGYGEPIALSPGWCTLSILFSDWDRTGRRDLRLTNDRHYYRDGEEQLWRVAADEQPRLYTHDEGWQSMQIWGMGIASHDLTGDGRPEVYLTSQGDNKLQTLAEGVSQPTYRDIAFERGVTAHRPFAGDVVRPSTAWHPEFQDVNNDGLIDLFVSKGNVEAMIEYAAADPNNLLLGQADGTFVESAEDAGILSFARARGAALTDLNLDGMLDLVVVNRRENVNIWRNVGSGDADRPEPMGTWVGVRLRQSGPNPDAIGSWIEVKIGRYSIRREVTVGGGHAGGQNGWIHFGLGDADNMKVKVQWPDGAIGSWITVNANQFVTVDRGSSEALPHIFDDRSPQN